MDKWELLCLREGQEDDRHDQPVRANPSTTGALLRLPQHLHLLRPIDLLLHHPHLDDGLLGRRPPKSPTANRSLLKDQRPTA